MEEPAEYDDTMRSHSFNDDVFFDISIKKSGSRSKETSEFNVIGSADHLLDMARNLQPLPYYDDFRADDAWRDGGFQFDDQEQI
jgi:hypothetical protein